MLRALREQRPQLGLEAWVESPQGDQMGSVSHIGGQDLNVQ